MRRSYSAMVGFYFSRDKSVLRKLGKSSWRLGVSIWLRIPETKYVRPTRRVRLMWMVAWGPCDRVGGRYEIPLSVLVPGQGLLRAERSARNGLSANLSER